MATIIKKNVFRSTKNRLLFMMQLSDLVLKNYEHLLTPEFEVRLLASIESTS